MTEKLKQEVNPLSAVVQQVAQICPAAVQNGKIDFERLRTEWSADFNEPDMESYNFTWVGKNAAIAEANKKIRKTLRPVKDDSKDWENTQNLYIEGDNLEVLKLLQESYLGKVKMIYIDPPYNTGNDFVYCDDFTLGCEEYIEKKGQCDIETNERLFRNTETNGRFHSDWCSMIYPRLKIARDLLSDDGVIFISIDDHEVANLRKICDEVFGESNFVENFVWESIFRPSNMSKLVRKNAEYVLCYAKRIEQINELIERMQDPQGEASLTQNNNKERELVFPANYVLASIPDGVYKPDQIGDVKVLDNVVVKNGRITNSFRLVGKFKWSQEYLNNEINSGVELRIKTLAFIPYYKKIYQQTSLRPTKLLPTDLIGDVLSANAEMSKLFETKYFDYPKPVSLIRFLINLIPDIKDALIFDFFAGSATTAHAVMQLNAEDGGNRKFIMVQLPEATDEKSEAFKAGYKNICEIGMERIRRAGDKIMSEHPDAKIDTGFRVFRLDDTNMKDVYYKPVDTAQDSLLDMVDNIKPDRTDMDLLFGAMLERGLTLDMPVEEVLSNGITYYVVNNGNLIACFAENIPESVIHEIANRRPLQALFRDSSFAESKDKINLTEIFKNVDSNIKVCVL